MIDPGALAGDELKQPAGLEPKILAAAKKKRHLIAGSHFMIATFASETAAQATMNQIPNSQAKVHFACWSQG